MRADRKKKSKYRIPKTVDTAQHVWLRENLPVKKGRNYFAWKKRKVFANVANLQRTPPEEKPAELPPFSKMSIVKKYRETATKRRSHARVNQGCDTLRVTP
jgi:hypothetical protein